MRFELLFTDREITARAGMGLMKRMLDHLGFDGALRASAPPQPGRNRGYARAQGIEGLWDRSKTLSLPVRFTPVSSTA